ncbi:hypothetical protein KP509_17G059500 [Ceratopteris richardii]|nr:hypothetical protein KP509_17G059500 [Ceratopteris richardii]KAH7373497.1 hypothetical protein KP509_17G059500 [Ceratopteris richardii]
MNSSSLTVNTTAFATVGSDSMVTLPPAPTHFSNSTSNQINNLQAPPPQPSVLQSGTAPNISVGADSQDYSLHLKVTNVADVSGFPPTAVSIHLPHPVLGMAYPSQHPIANPAQLPRYSDDDEDDEDDSIDDDDTEDNEDEEPKFQPGPPQTDDSSFVLRHSEDSGKRKRKRPTNMMAFFESLFEMVIDRQEKMQRKFFEAMEKRESDRMIREEAWRRQEMAMLSREHELRVQEQNSAAARDAALIAFLQKVTGQPVDPVNAMGAAPIPAQPVIAPIVTHSLHSVQPPHSMQSVQPLQSQYSLQTIVPIAAQPVESPYPSQSSALISVQPVQSAPPLYEDEISHQYEDHEFSDSNSKRWLKPEVLHLIELHNSLRAKFSEAGPKGPLWEAIANGMAQKGYPSRTAKRCKEKWENINKYFKRAKESNKKRPENSKTCPYFHELDALYSRKSSSQVHHGPMERVQGDNINIYQQPIANSGEGLANCNYEEQPNTISNSIPADQPGTSGGEVLASSDSNNHIIGSANATMAGVNASNGFMHNVVPMQLAVEAYQGLDASNASAHTPGHRFPVEVGPSMHQRLSITENHQDKQAAEISTTSRELEKAQTMAPQFQVQ